MNKMQPGDQLSAQNDMAVNQEWFDSLYHRYHQAVYANIFKMVHQPQAAEDILQEVFLALWTNRRKLNTEQVAGWLFVVSYNKAASCLKKKLREAAILVNNEALPEPAISPASTDDDLYDIRLSIVEEAIGHLPARKKEVFRLCRFEGKSYDEAAALLGISAVSVRDYLKQSSQFIKKYVSRHYPHIEAAALSLWMIYMAL